jgi:predicted transcriptional regulator
MLKSLLSTDPPETTFDLATLAHLLSSERRLLILSALSERPTDIGTLSTTVAAAIEDVDQDELTSDEKKRTYVSLYQTHLPTLADHDIVASDGGEYRLTGRGHRIAAIADHLAELTEGDR